MSKWRVASDRLEWAFATRKTWAWIAQPPWCPGEKCMELGTVGDEGICCVAFDTHAEAFTYALTQARKEVDGGKDQIDKT